MRYLSVCSGIEAATVAWHSLGWSPAAFSEIEAFPRAVLKQHYPHVPLHGDFTTIRGDEYGPIDLLVGGTPCQDFSVAGLRAGIAGERGNLTLEFLRLAARAKPRWLVWENVPGVLSSDGGRALGAFLGGLAELGYGFAYRVLDAQYAGLAQRRERVFVVAHLGDWRRPAAVLLEPESLRWNPPPRREAGERAGRPIASGSDSSGGYRNDADTADSLIAADVAGTLTSSLGRRCGQPNDDNPADYLIAHTLTGEGFDAGEDGTGRGVPLVLASGQANAEMVRDGSPSLTCLHEPPILVHAFDARQSDVIQYGDMTGPLDTNGHTIGVLAFSAKDQRADAGPISPTLRAGGFDRSHANGGVMPATAFSSRFRGDDGRGYGRPPEAHVEHVGPLDTVTRHSVAFTQNSRSEVRKIGGDGEIVGALAGDHGVQQQNYIAGTVVRRLTPRECERLQGFPDDYTLIPWRKGLAPDGPRYKSLGNSMAVPCMSWLGRRIQIVEDLCSLANPAK